MSLYCLVLRRGDGSEHSDIWDSGGRALKIGDLVELGGQRWEVVSIDWTILDTPVGREIVDQATCVPA
jgi:hypothetical protein